MLPAGRHCPHLLEVLVNSDEQIKTQQLMSQWCKASSSHVTPGADVPCSPPPVPAGEGRHLQGLPGFHTVVPGCAGHPTGRVNATSAPPVWAAHEFV